MSEATIRPSRQAYEASWPQRKRQAFSLGGGALVAFLVIVVVGIVRQRSNALLILLLVGVAGLATLFIFASEFGYLRNATITVGSWGMRLSGVPLSRTRTSPAPASFERVTIDFGRGVQRRAWILSDQSGRQMLWMYADFWDESDVEQLALAAGASVSGAWTNVVKKPSAPRW